jgi:hypothetical protein
MLGGGDITCFVATAVFFKKIEDDIIITCNVNNNNKTIKRVDWILWWKIF